MRYFDDNDIKESVAMIKKYCDIHPNCTYCMFSEPITYNGEMSSLSCKLHNIPSKWDLKEDNKND